MEENNMSSQKSDQNISTSLENPVTTTTASSHTNHPRRRIAENFLLLWVDESVDQSTTDCQNAVAQLRSVVNDVNIFTEVDQCIQFLNGIKDEKAFVVVSGSLGQHLVPDIHALSQLDAIYIFCSKQFQHEEWTKEWIKIKGVHGDTQLICEALHLATKQCNQDSVVVNFVNVSEETSLQNLDQIEPSFMYTQLFKEIFLEMEHDEKSIQNLVNYCRTLFNGNTRELNIINEFEHNYRLKSPIWWYTRECFTYQMLNRVLRTLEADTIIKMGFFIRDLHQQIEELHKKQIRSYRGEPFIVYRGQGLLQTDFEKMLKTKGGLMSFSNFLSTSKNRDVSLRFAKRALGKPNTVSILFEMSIDPSISSTPFAFIREVSYYKTEEEILFSMHTIFRIGQITKIDNDSSFYQVELKLTSDDDPQLRILTNRMREEIVGETGWKRLGQLLIKLGQFDQAQELYNVLLEQTSHEAEKASFYHDLGYINHHQGHYEKAIGYYEKTLKIYQQFFPSNHSHLAKSYNNIGGVYDTMSKYSKALSYYERALEIWDKTLPPDHPDLACCYNNIGTVSNNMGEYPKALSFFEKAIGVRQTTLPQNHPDLAISYNCIGRVYSSMGEYPKALSYYEKALRLRQTVLPPNHPDLATSYNNVGAIYKYMGEYSKALSFYEKALGIRQTALPPEHPDLATSYNNIGGVYSRRDEYAKALSFYHKALEMNEKALPPDHPWVATSYKNIAGVYCGMKEYSRALFYYEKAHNIFAKTLPPNHPELTSSCNSIGFVYNYIGEHLKALSYYEKALEIMGKTLPPNHPNFAESYTSLGGVYMSMREYSKALSYLERALDIFGRSLPPNHPDI